jgi:hypothetical protein
MTATPSLQEVISDPVEFISRLRIKDKSGKLRPFGEVITQEQIHIIRTLQEHKRVIIVKARQMGITTVCRAFAFWEAYTSANSLNSVVISNKLHSANALLDMDKRFLWNLPKALQRAHTHRTDKLRLTATETQLSAMSAKSDSQNRGLTYNTAHASEFAFYDEAEEFLASMLASINDGRIVLESTANYYGDAMHKLVQGAAYSDSWKVIFLPWSSFPQYSIKPPKSFALSEEEEAIRAQHNLTMGQMCWRRKKLEEMKDHRLFKREYPLTIDEAYASTDANFFLDEHFRDVQTVSVGDSTLTMLADPEDGDTYVVGVDIGGGCEQDYSVALVLSKTTGSPAAILSSNRTSIHDFTVGVMNIAKRYKALICFEVNNHGHAFKEVLDANRWTQYRPFTTSAKSKIAVYENLRNMLDEGFIHYLDDKTVTELRSLVRHDRGLAPVHPEGMHDDRCMALAIGLWFMKDIPLPKNNYEKWIEQATMKNRTRPVMSSHPLKMHRR